MKRTGIRESHVKGLGQRRQPLGLRSVKHNAKASAGFDGLKTGRARRRFSLETYGSGRRAQKDDTPAEIRGVVSIWRRDRDSNPG